MAEKKDNRWGIPFGPIVLIALGVVFLLNNMNLLQDGFIETVLSLWPLLLIFWGVNSWLRSKRVFGPVLLIGAGLPFLLANIGVLSVNPWLTILRLWPLLIIAIGLDVLVGKRTWLTSLIAVLLGLVLLAGGIWYSETQVSRLAEDGVDFSQPLGDLEEAQIVLQPSIASISVYPLVDSGSLIEGIYEAKRNEPYEQVFKQTGERATYTLQSSAQDVAFGVWDDYRLFWDIGLNSGLPLDLKFDLGVGDAVLDLKGLQLTDFEMSSGVGQVRIELPSGAYSAKIDSGVGLTTITLPENGDLRVDLDLGVGQVIVKVPPNLAVQIRATRGLAGISVPAGYARTGDVFTSPGYSASENRAEIFIDMGVGNISVQNLQQ